MNTRRLVLLSFVALLGLALPSLANGQRINSFQATATGEGTIETGLDKRKITAVLVILRENGDVDLTLYSDLQITGQGTWTVGQDASNGIDIKITGGVVTGGATGTGKIRLRNGGKDIRSLVVDAATGTGGKIHVDFVAKKVKKPN